MTKLCLIFVGVIAIAAFSSAWDNEDDSSLIDDRTSSRLLRSADARRNKGRKGQRGRKARKGKNGRKQKKQKKGRKNQSRSTGRTVPAECLETSHTIMKMWKDVIANFEKQSNRMEKQNSTGSSKSGKKGVFNSVVHKLTSVGGGNKSALSCSGSTTNPGAAQLKNLTDVLDACEDDVHMACNTVNFDVVNMTKLMACKTLSADFQTGAEECLGKTVGAAKTSTEDACACWTNSDLDATVQAAKDCKFSDEAKAFAAALKTCKNAFAKCRKYEDAAAESISACSSTSDDLTKEVAALSQNAAAVKEAQAVVKALAATRANAAAESCTVVNTLAIKLTALVLDFPSSPDIFVYSATIIASSSVVCTAEEKLSLGELEAMFDDAVATLDTAVEAAQGQLETLTGSTASPEEIASLPTPTPVEGTTVDQETSTPAAGEGCKCGVERTSRIVGGSEVDPVNKYPWMVALVYPDGYQFCGGTLVASKYVISAAHCMSGSDFQIRIGDHDLTTTGEGSLTEMTIDVASYTNHENYDEYTIDNDITIIELAQEVDLATYTPACLAKTSDTTTFDGKNAWVYGWGALEYGTGDYPDVLMEVEVGVVTNDVCSSAYSGITDSMICAGGVVGEDSCQGDSGGPLTYKSGLQHVLIGDVSWGQGCATSYGVYGRISYFREWIEGKMSSPTYCGAGPDADA